MLNILVISGGTGSIALQNGFAELYGYDHYHLDVVINAYDNGKSTGACRRIFNGKILGPSDLRKNQTTQYKLAYKESIRDPASYESKLLSLLELRFSAKDCHEYYRHAYCLIKECTFLQKDTIDQFIVWLKYFFFTDIENEKYSDTVKKVSFEDFSLFNIFYSSCAAMNGYSLAEAGRKMAHILGLENRVHLISNKNLYLSAQTVNGYFIEDEEAIVSWHNAADRIEKVVLTDENGSEYSPAIGENDSDDICGLIQKANIIIFSSGTQWSSLIPTYMHKGFQESIRQSPAKKYLIMNNIADDDMTGLCADDVLRTVGQFLDLGDITVVVNDNAQEGMRHIAPGYKTIHGKLSGGQDKEHTPKAIAGLIMRHYFHLGTARPLLIADLDGTLWDEKGTEQARAVGARNLDMFEGLIFSGNNYDHVRTVTERYFTNRSGNEIFCDYGVTSFSLKEACGIQNRLTKAFAIEQAVMDTIEQDPNYTGKATLRGDSIITIKPLVKREKEQKRIKDLLKDTDGDYEAKIAGRTSIDVTKKGFTKAVMLEIVIKKYGLDKQKLLYIGNELEKGNEVCIRDLGLQVLQVNDVFEMAVFLQTYLFAYGNAIPSKII